MSEKETQPSYFEESTRPFACLIFVIPLLLAYEAALLILGPDDIRNGADAWLRESLKLTGFGQYFLLPLLTIGVLIGWHHIRRDPWKFRPKVLGGMAGESVLWAIVLLIVAHQSSGTFTAEPAGQSPDASIEWRPTAETFFGSLGAGVYEEVLFRLILLPTIGVILLPFLRTKILAYGAAAVLTSLLFSLAHYEFVSSAGDPFGWYTFCFRFVAGLFFAALFLRRGFGVAVGAHAGYDALVLAYTLMTAPAVAS